MDTETATLLLRNSKKVIGDEAANVASELNVEPHGIPDAFGNEPWEGSMEVIDDSNTSYTVTITYMVSPEQMQEIADSDYDASVIDWTSVPSTFTIQ